MKVVQLPGAPAIPQIEFRPLASLVKYHRNSRTHSASQVAKIEALMIEFGWTNVILVDDMGIVAGHGRSMAAENIYKRGEQIRFPNGTPIPIGQVPVIDCTGWTPQQRRAYIIADNRSAMDAGWDEEMLRLELQELEDDGYNLELTAFDEGELAELLADLPEENDKDPDDAPPVPEEPVSRQGDVWVLGPHRLAVGDSTTQETWDSLMQGELADICVTDPPYNVDVGGKNASLDRADKGNRGKTGGIKNDKMPDDDFAEFLAGAYRAVFCSLKPGATIYVAHSDKAGGIFRSEFEKAGFKFSQNIIWKKNQLVLGMSKYQPIHEPIIMGSKPGSKLTWNGGRKQTTVMDLGDNAPFKQMDDGRWQIRIGDSVMVVSGDAVVEEHPSTFISVAKPAKSGLHPTTKPCELIERLMRNSARRGDIVIDGFGGSGTTLVAADRMGMYARLVEFDERYADVICRRYEMLTGRKAIHAMTGEFFPDEGQPRANPSPVKDVDIDVF